MSLCIFSMELVLLCGKCGKSEKLSYGIYAWSQTSDVRDSLLDTQRRKKWFIPYTARQGQAGNILCPDCAENAKMAVRKAVQHE